VELQRYMRSVRFQIALPTGGQFLAVSVLVRWWSGPLFFIRSLLVDVLGGFHGSDEPRRGMGHGLRDFDIFSGACLDDYGALAAGSSWSLPPQTALARLTEMAEMCSCLVKRTPPTVAGVRRGGMASLPWGTSPMTPFPWCRQKRNTKEGQIPPIAMVPQFQMRAVGTERAAELRPRQQPL